MYLPIIESMMFVFLVLEQYCIERVMEQKAVEVLTFFDAVESLLSTVSVPVAHEVMSTPVITSTTSLETKTGRIISEIDEESNELFSQLNKELFLVEPTSTNERFPFDPSFDKSVFQDDSFYHSIEQGAPTDQDYLSIHDIQEEIPSVSQIHYASARIKDTLEGFQEWIVKVEEVTESEILVTDGQKIWVRVGKRKASKIQEGEYLQLDINRIGSKVIVERVFRLEQTLTDDYLIPDENYEFTNKIASSLYDSAMYL